MKDSINWLMPSYSPNSSYNELLSACASGVTNNPSANIAVRNIIMRLLECDLNTAVQTGLIIRTCNRFQLRIGQGDSNPLIRKPSDKNVMPVMLFSEAEVTRFLAVLNTNYPMPIDKHANGSFRL